MPSGEDGEGFPNGAIEDIAYLSRSASRVRILAALASDPQTRGDLEETTGIARTTIGRIVNEFEERGWARRTPNGKYSATPPGKAIISEFRPFVQSVQAIRTLGNLVAWLPTDEVPLDLHHLSDVSVRRPEPADPMSTVTEFNARLDEASEFQCLVGIAPPIPFEQKMRNGVVDRGMETKHVITDEELNYLLKQPERLPRWREYVEAGANLYRYDGRIPCNIFVFDDTVIFSHTKSEFGEPHVGIVSDNPEVVSWSREMIEKYRQEAESLDSSVFSTDVATSREPEK